MRVLTCIAVMFLFQFAYANNIEELINEKKKIEKELYEETEKMFYVKKQINDKIENSINSSNIKFKKEIKEIKKEYRSHFVNYKRNLNNGYRNLKKIDSKISKKMEKPIKSEVFTMTEILVLALDKDTNCYNKISENNKSIMISDVIICNNNYIKETNELILKELDFKKY